MSNTINADNGVVSGVAGLKYSADTSGQLILQTNTTNAVTIDTTQNATFATGILATNPFTGTYTDGTIVDYITGVGRINVGPSDDIAFYHNGIGSRTEIARFTYTGRLGVGTASPSTKIQATVSPSSGGDDGMRVTDGTRIIQINITGSAYSYIGIGASETMLYSTGNPLNIVSDGQPIKFITGTSEKMRLSTAGYLGIGTTSPVSSLDVQGNVTIIDAAGYLNNLYYAGGWKYRGNGYGLSYVSDGTGAAVWSNAPNNVSGAGAAATITERMRIDSSGNVGIGVSGPAYRLDVRTNSNSIDGILSRNDGQGSSAAAAVIVNGYGNSWVMACGSAAKNSNALTFELDASAPSERLRLNTGGTLILRGGSTSATGTGITFPATQSASSDANTLDDYEEGTWTPVDASGGGVTLVAANGRYVKIGRLVQIWFRAQYPSTANTNTALIGGLPFTGAGSAGSLDVAGGWNQHFSQNQNTTFEGYINTNSTTLTVYNMISNQTIALTNSTINQANIYAYGFYYANA